MVKPMIFAVAAPRYCGRSIEISGTVTHNSGFKLNSKPGETRFVARLPIQQVYVEEG
jgi:hypothetical protein